MIERGDKAKYAKHVFYTSLNDVDVFIEDTAVESKKIYVQLLRRALGGDIKLSQVFPIGTKSRVIDRCQADQGKRNRPAVYIVDGDLDYLTGVAQPSLQRFYRLKRYCIENYFVDESAWVEVLNEEVVSHDREEIKRILDFENWISRLAVGLKPLVIASAVTRVKQCGLPNVNIPISHLCSCESGDVDQGKILAKVAELKTATDTRYGVGVFDTDADQVSRRLSSGGAAGLLAHVSGKSLLFPLVKRRSKTLFRFSHNDATLRLRLSMRCDVSELADISTAIA